MCIIRMIQILSFSFGGRGGGGQGPRVGSILDSKYLCPMSILTRPMLLNSNRLLSHKGPMSHAKIVKL